MSRSTPVGVELPVGDAGGEDDGVRADRAAVGEAHRPGRPVDLEPDDVAGGEQLGAELDRLPPGPVGELGAGDAVGEAEVVLDPRALPGLPAGGHPLDQHRAQPLGRAVDRRAEPGRAAADDDQVVEVLGRGRGQPDAARPARRRSARPAPCRPAVTTSGRRAAVGAGGLEQPLALGLSLAYQR